MTRLHVPAHIATLPDYFPGRPVEEVARELGVAGMALLASNENPRGPSPAALAAAREAMAAGNRYPDSAGVALRRALAERCGVEEQGIALGNGSTEIVEILARGFLEHGLNAVVSEGAFVMYRIAVVAAGGACRLVSMTADLRHDLTGMAMAIDAETRLVYIANPNNPTGTYVGDEELAAFLERVPEHVVVVLDEAYREYVAAPDYPDSLRHLERGRPLVLLRTFSKIYGLAGLRMGYALTLPEIARLIDRVRSPYNTSSVGQATALAALRDQEYVDDSRRLNSDGIAFLAAALAAMEVPFTPSVANFLLVHPPAAPEALCDALLERGVFVRPMPAFGFPRSIRVSVGIDIENRKFVRELARVLGKSIPNRS